MKYLPVVVFLSLSIAANSQKISPDKPQLSKTNFNLDSLPESEINIPIQIALRPLYATADKNVDTVFTSDNWPNGWVQETCNTRYKYQFKRGPLTFSATANQLNIGFTGLYNITGSTRFCAGSAVLSPWTPPCNCGGNGQALRKVNVSFKAVLSVLPNYLLKTNITVPEPVPVDKCTVCFWGQDITNLVMKGLKEELDSSASDMLKSYGTVDLKPQMQQLWNQLNTSYNLNGMGWLQINPQKFHLNNLFAKNDTLNIYMGLSAKPVVRFEKPTDYKTLVPYMSGFSHNDGFNIFLDAVLNYDSLSAIVNMQLKGQRFDLDKGLIKKKYIIVDAVQLYGSGNEKLVIKINFSGSANGIIYLTGKPIYDASKKEISLAELDFDVKTKAVLLKTAGWMFNNRIIREIEKNARFDLTQYADTAMNMLTSQLNQEWIKGVKSIGNMERLEIIGIYPDTKHLIIRSNAAGNIAVKVESIDFDF